MKKVMIIGGGISGMTAGIYAQQNGYETEIYEKNTMIGGECTGWNRQGYHVDNCIHWLTGCRPTDDLYEIWQNIGAINPDTKFYHEPYFYKLEMDNKSLHFWRDLEKARQEFLTLAPEDRTELNRFFDSVKHAECVKVPCKKSMAEMNFIEYMKFGMTMAEMSGVIKEYGKDTVSDLAQRFKNPYVREMMRRYFDKNFMAIPLISSYGFYSSGTGAIPVGGSVAMAHRVAKRYKNLGGKIHLNMLAERVNIQNGRVVSVTFADGKTVPCDFVIFAVDTSVTFGKLLDKKYMDKNLKKMYDCRNGYPVTSGFNASFGILGEGDYGTESGSVIFPCDHFLVGKQNIDFLGLRMYDYDDTLFPKNKRVIQCNILQDEDDFPYWEKLYSDRETYQKEKQRIADAIKSQIVAKYPQLDGRLILLSTYSPMTFQKWCGAYKGAYMSFWGQKGYKSLYAKNRMKGLSNAFVASQWLQLNGGLPLAAASGKFAADVLFSSDK